MKLFLAALACLMLAACASSHILVGKARPAISPEQVQIYVQPPAHFEQVAILEASSQGSFAFTSQQKTNKVVARLKKEAAALGANGILLQGIGNGTAGSVGTYTGSSYGGGSTGVGISAPVMIKEGSAMAIYVSQ